MVAGAESREEGTGDAFRIGEERGEGPAAARGGIGDPLDEREPIGPGGGREAQGVVDRRLEDGL